MRDLNMEYPGRKSTITSHADNRERGFTLLESLIVISMSMTIMAISIFQLQPTMRLFRARAVTGQVQGTLRQFSLRETTPYNCFKC
ncbi:MAG: hypothetical protein DMG55_28790 [Acidobacteria bacterium]|nr:MAG: hypothetical protein DMG55_28790 [Acidobacteriota bacterium]